MGWCEEHLESGCIFGHDETLVELHCPRWSGGECTLVHIMLTIHRMPTEVRRRVIAALYPAYGIEPGADPQPDVEPSRPRRSPS